MNLSAALRATGPLGLISGKSSSRRGSGTPPAYTHNTAPKSAGEAGIMSESPAQEISLQPPESGQCPAGRVGVAFLRRNGGHWGFPSGDHETKKKRKPTTEGSAAAPRLRSAPQEKEPDGADDVFKLDTEITRFGVTSPSRQTRPGSAVLTPQDQDPVRVPPPALAGQRPPHPVASLSQRPSPVGSPTPACCESPWSDGLTKPRPGSAQPGPQRPHLPYAAPSGPSGTFGGEL
ncbi:translation initiation factor IF-2-like [Artibeus jamaicensis]|uniref:translation initiation factor IF-2-like n=1 Tax=Artibeus jamaicensis TaxID=9417 RepID=UPI00235AAE3C|nr:translation initiation factor IF-2-like [Artibeus jamaicensis]